MKSFKFISIIIFLVILLDTSIAQTIEDPPPSIQNVFSLGNTSGVTCEMKIIPVSMIMNGNNEYDLESRYSRNAFGTRYDYVSSVYMINNNKYTSWTSSGNSWPLWADQHINPPNPNLPPPYGIIGRGIYRIEYTWNGQKDTCWLELDNGFYYQWYFTLVSNGADYDGERGIALTYQTYLLDGTLGPQKAVSGVGRYLKAWNPYPGYGSSRQPDFGSFLYDNQYGNTYSVIPQDTRVDCDNYPIPQQNHEFWYDKQNGNLSLNLTIDKDNVHTPTSIYNLYINTSGTIEKPLFLNLLPNRALTLANNRTLTLNPVESGFPGSPSFIMTVKTDGILNLNPNSHIIVNNDTKLVLECNAKINCGANSSIEVYPGTPGGIFCNDGADIMSGTLRVVYHNGYPKHYFPQCIPCAPDKFIYDSTQIILLDSAEIQIPDNTTWSFSDPGTKLVLSPNSKLIMGQNSKLTFTNGAHLIADHAIIVPDPEEIWDGIYLEGNSNDTIRNCTIENSANGINIIDKVNYMTVDQPSTEISNCTFINTSTEQLTNAIYVNNSYNVLIKGITISSTQLASGYQSGIMTEYCPAGVLNIVDNSISNCLGGISSVHSSPYIARNILTGSEATGKGIYFDNSNGVLKYNIVNNFINSFIANYSSPYLLKNTFSNASQQNIDLLANAVPVMRPITSTGLLNWVAGNNFITGSPTSCGINFSEEAYPDMNQGYNNFGLGTSNYLSGEMPIDTLFVTMNWWGEEPQSGKFAVTSGTVIYEPTYQGNPPTPDYYELNDIGFGLNDTVFVEDLGDTPGAENIFMLAYAKEYSYLYNDAIDLYKQVISSYESSPYAIVSLSRVFNCYEKKNSNNSEFLLLQNYMLQIKNNTNLMQNLRDIAEDFVIKSKVRMGSVQSAIDDYEYMYLQNTNNNKGIHALIDKEILTQMLQDTTDNIHSLGSLNQHKQHIASLMLGNSITGIKNITNSHIPNSYKLYQNYPNPFNPLTKIKFDLPRDGFVNFVVYDILGKEVYSSNHFKKSGSYEFSFDGSNLASGLYIYRIEAGNFMDTKKMVLIK